MEEEIAKQANDLLEKGEVQESTSAFRQNPVLAGKKDERGHVRVNFKHLNKITVKQKFPRPKIAERFNRLRGSAEYWTFDFADAFLQIPMYPDARYRNAFNTRTRKLQYTCMPLGLVNAVAKLQRGLSHEFSGPTNEGRMVTFMDEALVFNRTAQEHLRHLRKAPQLLQEKQ